MRTLSYLSIGLIFLAAVSIVSSFFKKGPVLLFSSASAVLWNFLFIPPRFDFYIERLEDLLIFLMCFISAIITGNLTSRLKVKELFLRNKENNLEELYQMSRILNETSNISEIINKSMRCLKVVFSIKVAVFLFDENLNLQKKPFSGSDFNISGKEWETALWCYKNKKDAGKSTDTFTTSQYFYMPLISQTKIFGVVGIDSNTSFDNEQVNLLTALIRLVASAIERDELAKTYQKIKISEESEKLYQILLNTVSHELRTPITTISASANGLIDKNISKDVKVRTILANDIIDSVDRLIRLVNNLLGTLRLESKKIKLNLEWNDITEVASIVRKNLAKLLKNHQLVFDIEKNIPMLKFDFILMEQLFFNLIHNAILYTPQESKITVSIYNQDKFIEIDVIDNGSGIIEKDKDKIFEKFYRSKGTRAGGVGLGLLLCKEISEIHKGTIFVKNNKTGGATFVVRLPLEKSCIKGELQ
jgi:two-component system, OmpR family, sensor histidine kinase KdpD